ncbi:hypothetical protein MBLNU457_6965t1 [Dothideomycetes sp. NU457]
MTRLPCLVAIQELQHAHGNIEEQTRSLLLLKNDIIGHGLRKELVVKHGILDHLERIITAKLVGKKAAQHTNGSTQEIPPQPAWTPEDELRLQATLVLGILARGGPAFIVPILTSNVLPALINLLSPAETHSRLIAVTLKTLNDIASSWTLTEPDHWTSPELNPHVRSILTANLFEGEAVGRLLALLRKDELLSSATIRQQVSMVAKLIATTCVDNNSRSALVKAGFLDALAAHVMAYAMQDSQAGGGPQSKARSEPSVLANILNAVSAIIQDSNYRTYRLLLSHPFQFLHWLSEGSLTDAWLPQVLPVVPKVVSFGSQSFGNPVFAGSRSFTDTGAREPATVEPFCSWLIYLARTQTSPSASLAILRLLGIVNATSTVEAMTLGRDAVARLKNRERQLALLAVPLAVKLVQDSTITLPENSSASKEAVELREEACSVLATLIEPSQDLQTAAVNAGAIKHVTKILRKSFDPINLARPMWSSHADVLAGTQPDTASARLGDKGVPQEVVHAMKVRAAALHAIAAIAARDDDHKKAVVAQSITNHLIDSLAPLSKHAFATKTFREGNTIKVLIAACHAARSLSRSVSLLRTSLIDAGLAKPILALIVHPDDDVSVAATNVACNLVLEFSPMRQNFFDAGAIKILCVHARRSHHELRVASLWTLKHAMLHAPRDKKIEIVDELGSGFLVQAMSGEQRSGAAGNVALGMSTPNAAGEQVDLLNAPNSPEMDIDDDFVDNSTAGNGQDDEEVIRDSYATSNVWSTRKPDKQALVNLRNMKEREQNVHLQARQQDYMVQEQALDIVRNLIMGDDSADMIDHINASIGLQRIFEIVEAKLVGGHPRNTAPVPTAVVASTIHIINHLAAANAKYKQTLIAQKPILKAWAPLFGHPARDVRIMCVWTVINLTWVENQSDREDARKRAQELRTLGIDEKIRQLANDPELDVRERVKVAQHQLEELESTARPR